MNSFIQLEENTQKLPCRHSTEKSRGKLLLTAFMKNLSQHLASKDDLIAHSTPEFQLIKGNILTALNP